jgi:hypothetical protein
MRERTPREEKYIKMLEAALDLGTEFHGCAELQHHYKDEVQRHTTLLEGDKKYAALFNSYAQRKEKEEAFGFKMLCEDHATTAEKSKLHKFALQAKMIGSVICFLPKAVLQRKREEKLVALAYAPQ